mmetsp:Transcript_15736/g.28758  ORF Transcript_15736/g.28758 Transcript_15736/m.28758 type:complete len:109 (+) Transcript_15736:2736-3062(+)
MSDFEVEVVAGEGDEDEEHPLEMAVRIFDAYRADDIRRLAGLARTILADQVTALNGIDRVDLSLFEQLPAYQRRVEALKKRMRVCEQRRARVLSKMREIVESKPNKVV